MPAGPKNLTAAATWPAEGQPDNPLGGTADYFAGNYTSGIQAAMPGYTLGTLSVVPEPSSFAPGESHFASVGDVHIES